MKTIISIVVPTAGTVITYDQWEDGYEPDINAKTQSSTQIWGDGDLSNGTAPGYPTDILPAGVVITLNNNITLPRNVATLAYDGRDRVAASAAIAITRAGWGIAPGTVLASATEVYDTRRWGTSYKIPVGITTGSAQNFEYSSLHIVSSTNNTTVQVDVDGNGSVDQTKVLNTGDSMFINGTVKAGATVTANNPVQVHEITGDIGSNYEGRTFAIRPTNLWGSSYYAPVGTTLATEVHLIFLYNPGASAITVNYETNTGTGTISVPANGNAQFSMPMNSGAHFYTTGGQSFYAVGANDAGGAATANQTHDWGYALVPESYLTTGLVVGFGLGSDDLVAPTGPDQNGSPVWVTPNADTTVYVNYTGDFTVGALTAPNGLKYDIAYAVKRLQSQTIYNPTTKDMTKARIFTTDGVKLAGAWGEDPSKAGPGAPYLDMGITLVPFPQPSVTKTSAIVGDLNSDGFAGTGDTLEYTIKIANEGVVDLYNTIVLDVLPNTVTYVPGSTKINGTSVIDDTAPATKFPVDELGYTLSAIPPGAFSTVIYRVTVNAGTTTIVNSAIVSGGGLFTPITTTTIVPVVTTGGASQCTLAFTDVTGATVTGYTPGSNVYVTLTDADANTNVTTIQTQIAIVKNLTAGDIETITLTETGVNTGVFRNTSALPSSLTSGLSQGDNTLYGQPGNSLQATHTDPTFGDICVASATITAATLTKKLYLSDPNQALDRIDPVAANDLITASTAPLGNSAGAITKDGSTSTGATTSTSLTIPHTTGGGANHLMLVSVVSGNVSGALPNATAVTYNGTALTSVTQIASSSRLRTQIFSLLAPPSGTANVVITLTNANSNPVTASVSTFSGVNQTTPLGTPVTKAPGKSNSTSITVTSATGELVYDTIAVDGDSSNAAQLPTPGASQTSFWTTTPSTYVYAAASTAPGAASINMTWTWPGVKQECAIAGVPIKPAPVSSAATFTQTPAFKSTFTLPSGATPSTSAYYTVSTGTMPASPAITAKLMNGVTVIATSTSAAASSSSGNGLLTFTFPAMSSAYNFVTGNALSLQITSAESGVSFTVDYDSTTKPSVISLPTNTVITMDNFGLYDAPYPGGNLITTITNGQRVYARATTSDPFGSYDITSLDLAITDPSNATSNQNLTTTVSDNGTTKVFEYSWITGPTDGAYSIRATANEGTEGINATAAMLLQVASLDLGTPSTTTFTDSSGNTVNTYTTTGPVYVQVVDRDQNTNPLVAETVIVVVTTSNGDKETITLTETGPNTGIFRSADITTNTSAVTQENNALNVTTGIGLTASYVDPTDPSDTSNAVATIPSGTVASVNVQKTLVSPTSGKALVGDTITYNLTVTNTGTGSLATVNVLDTYPTVDLQYLSTSLASPVPVQSTSGANTIQTWSNIGALAAGQSTSFTVSFKALAAGATVTNLANVTGTASGSSSINVAIDKPAVTVTKTLLTPGSGPIYVGDQVTWQLVITNTGSTSIPTLPLTDTFSGIAFSYVSATVAPTSTGSGSILWSNIGTLAAAASKTIDVTMNVTGAGSPSANTADVSYAVDANGNAVPAVNSTASVVTIAGSIGNTIFKDTDNNGLFDSGEGLVGVYVYSDTNNNGVRDAGEPFAITDATGTYTLTNLAVGSTGTPYKVRVDTTTLPTGLTTNIVDPDATKDSATSVTLTRAALTNTTANFGYRGTASVGEYLWIDLNGNGVQDATEPPLAGVKVFVDLNGNGTWESNEPTATTTAAGAYTIGSLPDGTYSVVVLASTLPAGVTQTGDPDATKDNKTSVTLSPGQVLTTADFGYQGSASIGDYIWNDANGNGVQDATELPLSGVKVFIDLDNDGIRDANEPFATTNSTGAYVISGLVPGSYTVVLDPATKPPGTTVTGDPDPTKDGKTTVTLVAGQSLTTADFGLQGNASIGDSIWNDTNGNGNQDPVEIPLTNVVVFIDRDGDGVRDANEPSATTNGSGIYSINGLVPGTYTVAVDTTTIPAGATQTGDPDGTFNNQTTVTLSAGEHKDTADFGYQSPLFSISGQVRNDTDVDGDLADPDAGLAAVVIKLYTDPDGDGDPADGILLATTYTNGSGNYSFTGLPGGNYAIVETNPSGAVSTADAVGANDDQIAVTIAAANVTGRDFLDAIAPENLHLISGTVYDDGPFNDNAFSADDNPLAAVTVSLYADVNANRTLDPGIDVLIQSDVTSLLGGFGFAALPDGAYLVVETDPAGATSESDTQGSPTDNVIAVTLAGSDSIANDFLDDNTMVLFISGQVRNDTDGDGNPADLDSGINGVKVTIYTDPNGDGNPEDGVELGFTITAFDGSYQFNNLPPGTYVVIETDPAGASSTYDVAGSPSDNRIPVSLSVEPATQRDFLDDAPTLAGISGHVFDDGIPDDNDFGSGDIPITAVKLFLVADLNGNGTADQNDQIIDVALTDARGCYSFDELPNGNYVVIEIDPIDASSENDVQGSPFDSEIAVVLSGADVSGRDFLDDGLILHVLSGQVRDDFDEDGAFTDADLPVGGVVVRLFADTNGDGTADPSELVASTTTGSDGRYVFTNLPDGRYLVVETDPSGATSTADVSGSLTDNLITVTLAGSDSIGNDFLDAVDPSGYIYAAATGQIIPGGTIQLTGPGVVNILMDGSTGQYSFITDGTAGTYVLSYTPPAGYIIDPTRPEAGPFFDPSGGPDPTVLGSGEDSGNPGYLVDHSAGTNTYYFTFELAPGDPLVINNNIPLVEIKPKNWAEWQYQNALGGNNGPTANPDGDGYNNLQEFAFCLPGNSGLNSRCPLEVVVNGANLDAQITTVTGISGVTYTLEYIADLRLSTPNCGGWAPVTSITPTALVNVDGTTTLTYANLESLPGLASGHGFVRVIVDLASPATTTRTYAAGWQDRAIAQNCETFSNPFLKCEIFSGAVTGNTSSVIDLSGSIPVGSIRAQLINGRSYYAEVTAGPLAGHRWWIVNATSTAKTIAISTGTVTLTAGALTGSSIVVREAHTFAELFPPANFHAGNSLVTADKILVYDPSTPSKWVNYFLADLSGAGLGIHWVRSTDPITNRDATPLDACQGIFIHHRAATVYTTQVGHVRANQIACPLKPGYNLVGGGYPVIQTPYDRAMTWDGSTFNGFVGSIDSARSDTLLFWKGDYVLGAENYNNYWLVNAGFDPYRRWAIQGDNSVLSQDTTDLFGITRAAFYETETGNAAYIMPTGWTP